MFRRGRTDENSIDEEGQIDDGDEERKNARVACLLRCLISIISKLAAVSFSLILAEVILLIVVADYRFVDYFLSSYYLIFLTILILGEIPMKPDFMVEFIKGKLLSKWDIRGFCFTFIALSVMEQLSYVEGIGIPVLEIEAVIRTIHMINLVSLIFGLLLFLGPLCPEEEELILIETSGDEMDVATNEVESVANSDEVISNMEDLQESSDAEAQDENENDDGNADSDADADSNGGSSGTSITLYFKPRNEADEIEESILEESVKPEELKVKTGIHQFLEYFPLIAILPNILLLIEVFVMVCIIYYNANQVLVRVFFLAIIIILTLGEGISILPEEKQLPYIRQGFLKNWFVRGFLYVFVVASVMQQHMNARRDNLMIVTRIPRSDWDASAATFFWGVFNWVSLLIYFSYLVLGVYRMDSKLDELKKAYNDPDPGYI